MIAAFLLAASLCTTPVQIPVGPAHVEPQCSYHAGSIAAEGELVFGAWMTSRISLSITGSTSGGLLDASGALRSSVQREYNRVPRPPSVATNGERSLIAFSHAGGTFVQFVDEHGEPLANATRVSGGTSVPRAPRALWSGAEWIVVTTEGTSVIALRVRDDGAVSAREEVAAMASLVDAGGSLVLVRTSAGIESVILFSGERHLLAAIPANATISVARDGDGYLAAWAGADAGAGRIDAHGALTGDAIPLDESIADFFKYLAVTPFGDGSLVLWNDDGYAVHAAIVRGGAVVARFDAGTGFPLAATATRDGAIALISRGCGVVHSIFLPRGTSTFREPSAVSVAYAPQTALAAATTAILWKEEVASGGSVRLFATFPPREPVLLNSPGTYVPDADVASMGNGTAAAWIESSSQGSIARAARFDASGTRIGGIIDVSAAADMFDVAIAANDTSFTVVTAEPDVWATRISAGGIVEERRLLATGVDAYGLDAAMSGAGIVASWFDSDNGARITVRDPQRARVFEVGSTPALQDLAVAGDASLLVFLERSLERSLLRVLHPESGEEAIVAEVPRDKYVFAVADPAFRIAWAETDAATTIVHAGGQEVCLAAGNASHMTLRNGLLDALVTRQSGRVFLSRPPLPRRRAVR